MATQASAITFLSTPGQAFNDGMGFVQFYFGLPISVIIICLVFIPIYLLGHVALIEYSRGNVNWQIYLLGAPIFYVQYFFMTDEKTRIRYYIDHRKGKPIKTTF